MIMAWLPFDNLLLLQFFFKYILQKCLIFKHLKVLSQQTPKPAIILGVFKDGLCWITEDINRF